MGRTFRTNPGRSFELEVDFDLYFAVRTVDSKNGADLIYTQRGSASWEFDGSGTINAAYVWTQAGTGVTGSSSFTEVTSGAIAPVTTGDWMNKVAQSAKWETIANP